MSARRLVVLVCQSPNDVSSTSPNSSGVIGTSGGDGEGLAVERLFEVFLYVFCV